MDLLENMEQLIDLKEDLILHHLDVQLQEQENCVMMHDLNNKIKEQKDLIVQLIEKDVSINDIIEKDVVKEMGNHVMINRINWKIREQDGFNPMKYVCKYMEQE